MATTKKKRLTQREKTFRAQAKQDLQTKGILPPDKTRLNRKKFAKEVRAAWEAEDGPLYAYVMSAISWMLPNEDIFPVTAEQVGILKVLKAAIEMKHFEERLPDGQHTYNALDLYHEVIEPIIKL